MSSLLKSRKFWLCVVSIACTLVMLATKQLTGVQAETAIVAALGVLKLGIAIEDNGAKGAPTVNVQTEAAPAVKVEPLQ